MTYYARGKTPARRSTPTEKALWGALNNVNGRIEHLNARITAVEIRLSEIEGDRTESFESLQKGITAVRTDLAVIQAIMAEDEEAAGYGTL